MNWTFWTRKQPMELDDCGTIDSLLSSYADGMASAEEAQRVEAHLPGCAACRESLAWMRATRYALASRPVALPPADLRARIASAIAASDDAPVPVSFNTRRAFALRPMLTAAASVALLGVVSYGLMHQSPPVAVHPVKPPLVAAVPRVTPAPVVKTVPGPGVNQHLKLHPIAAPKHAPLDPDRVAANPPREATPEPVVVKTHPQPKSDTTMPDTKMLAEAPPIMAPLKSHLATIKMSPPRKFRPEMLAIDKGLAPSAVTRKTLVVKPEPKRDTVVAEAPHTQTLLAPTLIEKQPVITADPAPSVAVASRSEGRFRTDDLLGPVREHLGQMRSVAFAKSSQAASHAAGASKPDNLAFIPMVGQALH